MDDEHKKQAFVDVFLSTNGSKIHFDKKNPTFSTQNEADAIRAALLTSLEIRKEGDWFVVPMNPTKE